jgi:UDP-N-acetylmuramate-alanine ligase
MPIEGVSSEWLLEKISTKKSLVQKPQLALHLRDIVSGKVAKGIDCVVVTMGAGDIDRLVNDITKTLIL